MINPKSWNEFRESGVFWFINSIIHLFGWVLVLEISIEGDIIDCYPARTKYRGFDPAINENGYKRLTEHLAGNIDFLQNAFDEKEK